MAKTYYRSRRSNSGLEAARKHIYEANQLTIELGGTDEDVKDWFFKLPSATLEKVFQRYTLLHGASAGQYARDTFGNWKSNKRRMSGLVAGRLFSLLPPLMPLEKKLNLVDSLWQLVGPKRKRLITVGTTTGSQEIIKAVEEEVRALSTAWDLPTSMQNRFKWLSQNDSQTYQTLLEHIKASEKKHGENVLRDQIPILKHKFDTDLQDTTSRLSFIVEVGKQSVELRLVRGEVPLSVKDVTVVDSFKVTEGGVGGGGVPWWVWGLCIVGLFVLLS